MDEWYQEFDNWAFCDAMCFNLFDRTPYAWKKVKQWSGSTEEFVKRTGFALLWSLSEHDERAGDEAFLTGLELIEHAADDERNLVKKAVNMALALRPWRWPVVWRRRLARRHAGWGGMRCAS